MKIRQNSQNNGKKQETSFDVFGASMVIEQKSLPGEDEQRDIQKMEKKEITKK